MTIQSMENKGDGMAVIKISIPPEASKGKIHQQLTKFYGEAVGKLTEKDGDKSLSQEEKVSIYHQESEYMMSFFSYQLAVNSYQSIVERLERLMQEEKEQVNYAEKQGRN